MDKYFCQTGQIKIKRRKGIRKFRVNCRATGQTSNASLQE